MSEKKNFNAKALPFGNKNQTIVEKKILLEQNEPGTTLKINKNCS